jgi:predicted nucleotidyltransferase
MNPTDPPLILPIGTQVVTLAEIHGPDGKPVHPRRAVGVIVQSPADYWHAYRVRFPDGFEASLKRAELSVLAQFQKETAGLAPGRISDPLTEYNLFDFVIYRCVIGSRAYGLDEAASDFDRRGVYLSPANMHWSLYGVPEQLENDDTQETYWEMQKFLVLALKANPNVLECLYTPLVEHATDLAREMLAMRSSFLSKMVYQTFNGYVMSQFKKLQADLRNKGQVKWKHVMHLIRLLLSGIDVLKTGEISVHVGPHRQQLLAIKRGELPWDEVENWRLSLHKDFATAAQTTTLPDRPDYARANHLLLKARRRMV